MPPLPSETSTSQRERTRDEQAEWELRQALKEEWQPEKPKFRYPNGHSAPSHAHPSKVPNLEEDPYSIHPTNLYPRPEELSAQSAFDLAMYCRGLGGQFMNVYRYGEMRSCSEHWSHFWWVMRTNRGFYTKEQKNERIREHYWKRDAKYRDGPSSEDVWEMRDKLLDNPFSQSLKEYENTPEEKSRKAKQRQRLQDFVNGKLGIHDFVGERIIAEQATGEPLF